MAVVRENNKKNFMSAIITILASEIKSNEQLNYIINQYMEYDDLYQDEVVHIITKYVDKDLFKEFKDDLMMISLVDKNVISDLLEQEFINKDDIKNYINMFPKEELFEGFKRHY